LSTTGSETPGSRSILIPVAGAIAGIIAACGVMYLLKKRHSQETL
jgi:nitrate reductase gamma subunit